MSLIRNEALPIDVRFSQRSGTNDDTKVFMTIHDKANNRNIMEVEFDAVEFTNALVGQMSAKATADVRIDSFTLGKDLYVISLTHEHFGIDRFSKDETDDEKIERMKKICQGFFGTSGYWRDFWGNKTNYGFSFTVRGYFASKEDLDLLKTQAKSFLHFLERELKKK